MNDRPSLRERAPTRCLIRLIGDSRGATAIEYGLILAVVTLVLIGALIGLADVTTDMWGNVSTKVQNAH